MKNGLPFMKAFTILLDINNLRKDCFTSFAMTILLDVSEEGGLLAAKPPTNHPP